MTPAEREPRIVLTLDTSAPAGPALALAVALAKAHKRTLHGLFIEDTDLLNVSRLPFSQECSRLGGAARNFSPHELERHMARQAAHYREQLARSAQENALAWSYASVRTSKRRVTHIEANGTDVLVVAQPTGIAPARRPRILLLDGQKPPVLKALTALLDQPGYRAADLLVRGEFDAKTLKEILDHYPQVTRRLMGAPELKELLTDASYRPSLLLMARDTDALDTCLRLADCPMVLVAA